MATSAKKLTIASFIIAALLLAFVSFLLITNYSSQTSLKRTLLERFMIENERLAGSLSAFFNSRREDLGNLASSRVIEVFFENRALGMSMEYGLKQSLPPIKEKFYALMERYRLGDEQPYERIVLLDERGGLLVDARSSRLKTPTSDLRTLLEPRYRAGTVIARDRGREILVSAAYHFKDRYAGQIVLWVRPEFLFDYVIHAPSSSPALTYLMADQDVIVNPSVHPDVPTPSVSQVDIPVEFMGLWLDQTEERLIALRTPVLNTPFSVVTLAPAREVFGRLDPRGLLMGMAVLALVIIGSALLVIRLNTRSLVLTARLEESLRHEEEAIRKNRQLETEIAERKQAENALRQSEERYRTLIETSPDVIFSISAEDGAIRSLNPAFEKITGWPGQAWIGRPFLDIIHPDDRPLALQTFDEILRGRPRSQYELRCLTASGEYRTGEFTSSALAHNGIVVGAFGIVRDVTDRKKLEEQLRHAVKMEAVGQLAGGIAHDFNNMLSVIIGYCNILTEDMKADDPLRSYVDLIFTSAERAAQLTRNLLTFSRKQIYTLQPVDVTAIMLKVEHLITRLIGEDVTVRFELAEGPLTIMGDSAQIEQVLMNLATNARDAMPKGGHLTVTTARFDMGGDFKKNHGFGKRGTYARISIADTGVGMDNSTRERIFEPFFTTKGVGKGTGLGLAIVFGIVKQHRGYIEVTSEAGKGTIFTLYLPLHDAPMEMAAPAVQAARARGGSETILIAEDDTEVRNMLTRILRGAGYSVVEAVDGEDAVSRFRTHRDAIRLLMFDVIMPNRNGKEAYEEIKAERPGMKALFISGYTADIMSRSGISAKDVEFLSKPIAPAVLLAKVREVLDR